jgi:hypothetical protein
MTDQSGDRPDDVSASRDPELQFRNARAVVDADLPRETKIRILREWALDLREEMVAEDESMAGTGAPHEELGAVLRALEDLGAEKDPDEAAPTRLGARPGE